MRFQDNITPLPTAKYYGIYYNKHSLGDGDVAHFTVISTKNPDPPIQNHQSNWLLMYTQRKRLTLDLIKCTRLID